MGIAPAMVKLLMREGKKEGYAGNVLTIGRQDVYVKTTQYLQKLAEEMRFQLNSNARDSFQYEKINNRITDTILFLSLGFDHVDSLDISDHEQCTVIHDLNLDISAELYNKYDLIFDGGSSEHIFNLPKVWENYNKMLKVGGRLIHALPVSNHIDHGFYMFSPILFWEYYSANKWEIKDSFLCKVPMRHDKELWDIYSYTPGCIDVFSYGGFNRGIYAIYFIAKKTEASTYDAAVQQGQYSESIESKADFSWKKKLFLRIPERLQLNVFFLYRYILSMFPVRLQLKATGLKAIGRY